MNIEITTAPTEADAKSISQGLVQFSESTLSGPDSHKSSLNFCIFVRNDAEVIQGGLQASCSWTASAIFR